ncbi:hypothetical protein FDP41_006449 [Naegleria fowleri]|uniref:Uncharacterized protein n=1 Tax=Naegleria fowleri TaxID=5763 RepID=A0A6A5BB88_NAEFO|nr:uncharacterized protein FDP41_006449 [Naegleria fowleri]KAF0974417.1 hypothetical protein FDP41_006449 [Naegleria fowleri]CAG4711470.1 unnamed protein product [Naegleria fowleri]
MYGIRPSFLMPNAERNESKASSSRRKNLLVHPSRDETNQGDHTNQCELNDERILSLIEFKIEICALNQQLQEIQEQQSKINESVDDDSEVHVIHARLEYYTGKIEKLKQVLLDSIQSNNNNNSGCYETNSNDHHQTSTLMAIQTNVENLQQLVEKITTTNDRFVLRYCLKKKMIPLK